jgi:hypothetical protein
VVIQVHARPVAATAPPDLRSGGLSTPSEATVTTPTCDDCGYRNQPDQPHRNNRALFNIIDELGAATICSVCAVLTIADAETDGLHLTLMVSIYKSVTA